MQKNQRIILYILTLIAGASWIILSGGKTGEAVDMSAPQAGFTAPDFALSTASGEKYTLSELRGQAVLVNLWATWCPPCRAEMPAIEKVYLEYKDQGFIVLAINMTYQDDPFNIVPFTEQYGLTFPILLEETGDVARAYQLNSLPSSYFINRNGVIDDVVIGGPMSEALLRARVERLLK
ncbi:MAG: TlpA family protein disulfide reductase [Chloroflexi bacterium]|nr:TlpA family protein disulfide reductase [Chloroflexota bacterium]